jgi:flagellar biosynthesis protein FlhF
VKLKTYYSGTVEAAMELARADLGPDTMIVYSRKADKASRHLGEYEVVFATEETVSPAAPVAQSVSDVAQPRLPVSDTYSQFAAEVADLKRQMEQITSAISRASTLAPAHTPDVAEVLQGLLDEGLDARLAQEIVDEAQAARGLSRDRGVLDRAVRTTLSRRVPPLEASAEESERCRVIVLVGPPGVGKTLTLVKLAATLGLAQRRTVQILSADNVKIGAPDQLRTYAAILGIPFEFVETAGALERAVEGARGRKLILVDTPGYSPREMGEARALASSIEKLSDVEVHLVLSASTKNADLLRAVESYRIFGPHRLLFTRLDETASYGSILNTTIRSGLPVSFLCGGQSVPEDVEPATLEALLGGDKRKSDGVASAA